MQRSQLLLCVQALWGAARCVVFWLACGLLAALSPGCRCASFNRRCYRCLLQFAGQEPGTHAEIEQFVASRFGAQFPLMSKARSIMCSVCLQRGGGGQLPAALLLGLGLQAGAWAGDPPTVCNLPGWLSSPVHRACPLRSAGGGEWSRCAPRLYLAQAAHARPRSRKAPACCVPALAPRRGAASLPLLPNSSFQPNSGGLPLQPHTPWPPTPFPCAPYGAGYQPAEDVRWNFEVRQCAAAVAALLQLTLCHVAAWSVHLPLRILAPSTHPPIAHM